MLPDLELLKIKVRAGKDYEVDLNEALAFDEHSLNKAYTEQASLYAWWAAARAIAIKYKEKLKKQLNLRRSNLMIQFRKESEEKILKWTLSDIEARILADTDYDLTAEKVIEAEHNVDLLTAVCEALEHRREMLVSLGANVRTEHNQPHQ